MEDNTWLKTILYQRKWLMEDDRWGKITIVEGLPMGHTLCYKMTIGERPNI